MNYSRKAHIIFWLAYWWFTPDSTSTKVLMDTELPHRPIRATGEGEVLKLQFILGKQRVPLEEFYILFRKKNKKHRK